MARSGVIFVFLLLSACVPRAELVFRPDAASGAGERAVFVATVRAVYGSGFSSDRSEVTRFLRYDISVPATRETGTIPVPGIDEVDPETQFLARDKVLYPSPTAFRTDLRRHLGRPGGAGDAVIYVHGFNNTFDEGVLRITQLAEDFNIEGVALHYSWASAGNPFAYAYDRDSALIARDGLDNLISEVRAAGARNVILVAHSMGSLVVMETLRQRAIARPGSVAKDIGGVILISADLDVDLFHAQVARIGDLPDPFGLFVSDRDRVLALSARLTGSRNRLGNVESPESLADLDVTVIDVTEFSTGAGHFTLGTSPALFEIFANAGGIGKAFEGDSAGRTGFLPGTVLTVQNATEIILSPVATLATQ